MVYQSLQGLSCVKHADDKYYLFEVADIQCYTHEYWRTTGALALFNALFIGVGYPLVITTWLFEEGRSKRPVTQAFVDSYGFLYDSYRGGGIAQQMYRLSFNSY